MGRETLPVQVSGRDAGTRASDETRGWGEGRVRGDAARGSSGGAGRDITCERLCRSVAVMLDASALRFSSRSWGRVMGQGEG